MKTVLLIEDDTALSHLFAEILDYAGYRALVANTGLSGIMMSQTLHPDIIFCDINLTDINGYAVLEAVRDDCTTADTPFFFLTGHRREDVNAEVTGILQKPLDMDDLLSIIEQTIC